MNRDTGSWHITLISGLASKIREKEYKIPLISDKLTCWSIETKDASQYLLFTLCNLISIINPQKAAVKNILTLLVDNNKQSVMSILNQISPI